MEPYLPEKVYIERSVEDSPITENVLSSLPCVSVERIDSTESLLEDSKRWNPTVSPGQKDFNSGTPQGSVFQAMSRKSVQTVHTIGLLQLFCD